MQEEIENAICQQLDVGLHCDWGWRKPENLCSCLLPLILSSLCSLSTKPGLLSHYDLNRNDFQLFEGTDCVQVAHSQLLIYVFAEIVIHEITSNK